MRTPLVIAALVVAAFGSARADAPALDAVKAALPTWSGAIALPFTYQGLRYEGDDQKKTSACDHEFGAHGVVKDAKKLPRFVACLGTSIAVHAVDGKPETTVFDPAHVAPEMTGTLSAIQDGEKSIERGYPKKLVTLAKHGGLFVSHVTKHDDADNGYWDESWNVYVAHVERGAVKFDAVMVVLSERSPD